MAENIKYQINGQLADNTVTVDNKEDMILVPVSIGSANEARIIAEMKAEDSGLREETIKHVFELEKRVIKRLLMSGYGSLLRQRQLSRCHRELAMESRKELYRGEFQCRSGFAPGNKEYYRRHHWREGGSHVRYRRTGCRHPCTGCQRHRRTSFHPHRR